MALSFSSITDLPTPPTKSDPANFPDRADAFVLALTTFTTEINQLIDDLSPITSGLDQAEPIAAYNAGTTYDFPDVCAGSDGYTYRCVDTGVIGQDPTTDDGTYWVRVSTQFADEAEALAGTETKKAVAPDTLAAVVAQEVTAKNFLSMEEFIHVQHQQTSGTDGGSSVPGMNEITLNAEENNTLQGASLASNEVTLPTGTYYAVASASVFRTGQARLFLTDDDNNIKLSGCTAFTKDDYNDGCLVQVSGVFSLAVGDDVKLRVSTSAGNTTDGLGISSGDGQTEVYADLKIWRVGE